MKWETGWMTWAMLGLMAAVSGCDKVAGLSDSAQSVTQREYSDTKASWSEFFTYHPPVAPPSPQTRYCYKMQSDVVCYDSEQPTLTAKLIGYQDGDKRSWIQPGGGSLGASGGAPVSYRAAQLAAPAPAQVVGSNDYDMSSGPVSGTVGAGPSESHISVNSLPPIQGRSVGN